MSTQPIEYEDEWDYEALCEYVDDPDGIDEQINKLGHGIYLMEINDDEQN